MNRHFLFVACADLHLTAKTPGCRADDYVQTELTKFEELLHQAEHTEYQTVICAGDVFDHATRNISFSFLGKMIEMMQEYESVLFVTVPGNHDQRYWTKEDDTGDTALDLMARACHNFVVLQDVSAVSLIDFRRAFVDHDFHHSTPVFLTTAQWGTKIEDVWAAKPPCTEANNIQVCVTHRPVYVQSIPFWMKDNPLAITSGDLYDRFYRSPHGAPDFIITGDNHNFFIDYEGIDKETIICNPGTMMRSSIDFIDYEPRFVACGINEDGCCTHWTLDYPITEANDAFDAERVAEHQTLAESVDYDFSKLVETMQEDSKDTIDFPDVLRTIIQQNARHLEDKLLRLMDKYENG